MTTYKVTGPYAFQGNLPGEKFEAELDPEVERRATRRGRISVVKRNDKPEKEDDNA